MSILGIGTDIVDVRRMATLLGGDNGGERLKRRVFTDAERSYCEHAANPVESFAARFAAKEAVVKALRRPKRFGFPWAQIEIGSDDSGILPEARLRGRVAEWAAEAGAGRVHVSMAHDGGAAIAHVVIESDGGAS